LLKAGYPRLADFQENVGPIDLGLRIKAFPSVKDESAMTQDERREIHNFILSNHDNTTRLHHFLN